MVSISIDTVPVGMADHFYFNDVIINYTPYSTDLSNLMDRMDALELSINNLTTHVDAIYDKLDTINTTIANMNQSLTYINNTQENILTNIDNLWQEVIALNASIQNLTERLDNLPESSVYDDPWIQENLTLINTDIVTLKADISDIQTSIEGIPTMDPGAIADLQDRINETVLDISLINENITALWAAIPAPFDAANLTGRLQTLEDENELLRQQVDDLEEKVDDLEKEGGGDDDSGIMSILLLLGIGIIIIAILVVVSLLRGGKGGREEEKEEPRPSVADPRPMIQPDVVAPKRKLSATPANVVDVEVGGEGSKVPAERMLGKGG